MTWQERATLPDRATLAQRHREWMTGRDYGRTPCPVCQAVLTELPSGRYAMVHDAQRHREAGVGFSGYLPPDAPRAA